MPRLECEFEQRPDIKLRRSYAKGIPDFSQKKQAQDALAAWSPMAKAHLHRGVAGTADQGWFLKSKEFPESEYSCNQVWLVMKNGLAFFCNYGPNRPSITRMPHAGGEADEIIQRIVYAAVDPDLRDEDESAPTFKVIQETVRLIRGAEKLLGAMPSGQVSTFYGEVNITWRAGERIVRLACFPERPSVIQSGSLSLPVGSYRSEENPTAELLAERINSLAL